MLQIIYLLFAMSLSGTAALLLYLAATSLLDSYISASMRYLCLKICMLFFLLPFPILKHLFIQLLLPSSDIDFFASRVTVYPKEAIIQTANGFYFPFLDLSVQIVLGIWGIMLLTLIGYGFWRFWQFYHVFRHYPTERPEYLHLLSSLKSEMHIPTPVRLYDCNASISPFTCGAVHPAILLTALVDDDSVELTLRHELQHIQTHDFFYRGLAAVLILLHCFNPFAYILFRELTEVQEMNCDEHVLQTLSANEKKKYGHMIIDFAVRTQKLHTKAICFSRNNTRFLKKRIRKIASGTQKRKLLTPVLLTVLCLTAGIPVAAYSPYTIDWRNETNFLEEDDFTADWIEYSDDPTVSDIPDDEQTFSITDAYILTDEGEIIVLKTSAAVRAACKQHTYKSGTLKKHRPNGKGCTVDTYNSIYCTKCHFVKNKTFYSSLTYKICPH